MSSVYDWFEERLEIQTIADDISSKYVPPHVNSFDCLITTAVIAVIASWFVFETVTLAKVEVDI